MRVLITGITGFAGVYLAEQVLAESGVILFGTSRRGCWPEDVDTLTKRVQLRACDLRDQQAAESLLREARPELIYHLAGYTHAGRSSREPDAAWAGNLTMTRALYDAIIRWGGKPRILFVGSGLIYGDCEEPEQSHDERAVLRPATPYAASKSASDLVSYQYCHGLGLDIVRVRPFSHIGPRQSPEFALPHFAQQIAAIERGQKPPVLETGNLKPRRDLTDVRDTVRAYGLLAERGKTGEAYNVGTGQAYSMQEVLDRLLALAGVSVEVRCRPDLVRVVENNVVRACARKLNRETGWAPEFSLDQSLTDILEYWRLRS